MARRLTQSALTLLVLLVAFVVAIGLFTVVQNQGWLTPFGIESESHDSQVIQAIERTQEVSLLSLGVEGIKDEDQNGTFFGKELPFTEKKLFMRYRFDAKLGIDGSQVEVTQTGDNAYRISVPEFTFIGYEEPDFEVAVEDNGALSWATPDIEQTEMVNELLNDDARETYIADHEDVLKDQAQVFYDRLITSIDPDAKTTYEFAT